GSALVGHQVLALGEEVQRANPADQPGHAAREAVLLAARRGRHRRRGPGAAVVDELVAAHPLTALDLRVVALGPVHVLALVAVRRGIAVGGGVVGAGRVGRRAAIGLRADRGPAVAGRNLVGADRPLRDATGVVGRQIGP